MYHIHQLIPLQYLLIWPCIEFTPPPLHLFKNLKINIFVIQFYGNFWEMPIVKLFTKSLKFYLKRIWIFATKSNFPISISVHPSPQCRINLIFQTLNSIRSNNLILKYQRFSPEGWNKYRNKTIWVCGNNSIPLCLQQSYVFKCHFAITIGLTFFYWIKRKKVHILKTKSRLKELKNV